MLDIVLSNKFKKDLQLAAKRNYNIDLLDEVVQMLAPGKQLAPKYKDHALTATADLKLFILICEIQAGNGQKLTFFSGLTVSASDRTFSITLPLPRGDFTLPISS